MKIVDRTAFMAMPAGTVFAKYKPCYFEELSIKEDSTESDFYVQDLIPMFVSNGGSEDWFDTLQAAEDGTPTPPLDYNLIGRDGCFDADQLFAVFERHDVEALIARLNVALTAYTPHQ